MNDLTLLQFNTSIEDLELKNILIPQTSFCAGFNEYHKIKIYYISDIHLLHHLGVNGEIYYSSKRSGINDKEICCLIKNQIKAIVNRLFSEELIQDIYHPYKVILFGGDISSDTEITKYFYHSFQIRYIYYLYKSWRKCNKIKLPMEEKQAKKRYRIIFDETKKLYEKKIFQLRKWGIDYEQDKKNLSRSNLSDYILDNNLPSFIKFRIEEISW